MIMKGGFWLVETKKLDDKSVNILYSTKHFLLKKSYLARLVIPYAAEYYRIYFNKSPGIIGREAIEVASNGDNWQLMQKTILQLRNELKAQNAELRFVLFPAMMGFEHHPATKLHMDLGKWFDDNGIKSLDLLPSYKPYAASDLHATLIDVHPNAEGYAIAGKAVGEWLMGTSKQ
jgi:hypothetical protein